MTKFEEIYAINVNEYVEQKGSLNYLSWAHAWKEFKKVYPDATYRINAFDGTYCTGNEKMGYMVQTEVTAGEQTYIMWLPVMDMRNNTILQPKMTEINKTIMRCLTKNLAMFGLGLYIYAGEDLPDGENVDNQNENDGHDTNTQNKAKNTPKSSNSAKVDERITKAEMIEKWGVKNVETTVTRFVQYFGKPFEQWDREISTQVRETLQIWKEQREEKERKAREGLQKVDDVPFGEVKR